MVKKTTTADTMARDSCPQKDIHAMRLRHTHLDHEKVPFSLLQRSSFQVLLGVPLLCCIPPASSFVIRLSPLPQS